MKEKTKELRVFFLKKPQRFFCLQVTCPTEEIALKVENEAKTLGYAVERRNKEIMVRCELEVGRRALYERIKSIGIPIRTFEEESLQTRFEVVIEGEKRGLKSDSRLRLKPLSSDDKGPVLFSISINNGPVRRFRGELEVYVNLFSTPELINELDLEDYLKGVLPAEVPSDFPFETLKVQAIIARTYSIYCLGRHKKEGFDLCNNSHCQIYQGYDREKEKLNSAVEATKGIIVCYNEKPALTPFHASCGGIREDSNIWGLSLPYLRVITDDGLSAPDLVSDEKLANFLQKKDNFNCGSAPDFRWTRKYEVEEIEKIFSSSVPLLLSNQNLRIGKIKDIKVEERSPTGRVRILEIETEEGVITLRGDDIRWAFGDGRLASKGSLPSLLFYIEKQRTGDKITFKFIGGGAGHGVGFCQWGGAGLANKGYNCQQIINYYFPGTTLKKLY